VLGGASVSTPKHAVHYNVVYIKRFRA
jgi:hypothetical protein